MAKISTAIKAATSLEQLANALRAHHGDWPTKIPTFGGTMPASTDGVWSFDERRVLIGSCGDDLAIVSREEHEDMQARKWDSWRGQ